MDLLLFKKSLKLSACVLSVPIEPPSRLIRKLSYEFLDKSYCKLLALMLARVMPPRPVTGLRLLKTSGESPFGNSNLP